MARYTPSPTHYSPTADEKTLAKQLADRMRRGEHVDLTDLQPPENRSRDIAPTDGGNPVINVVQVGFLKLIEQELKRSVVQRNPKKFAFLGGFLVLAISYGIAVGIMLPIQMLTSASVMPSIISFLPFLSFLNPLGLLFGILVFAAMIAGLMLIPYGLAVFSAHKATQPHPPTLLEDTLVKTQQQVAELTAQNTQLQQQAKKITEEREGALQRIDLSTQRIESSTQRIFKRLHPRLRRRAEPSTPKEAAQATPEIPVPPSIDHSQTSSNSSESNPVRSPMPAAQL